MLARFKLFDIYKEFLNVRSLKYRLIIMKFNILSMYVLKFLYIFNIHQSIILLKTIIFIILLKIIVLFKCTMRMQISLNMINFI